MSTWIILFAVLVVLFTLISAILDVRTGKIPNWLTVPFFVAGVTFNTLWQGASGLQTALLGFLTGFGILFVLWLMGGGGGGDVKLMAALGAWLGPLLTVVAFVASAAVVLLMSAVVLLAALARSAASAPGTSVPRLRQRVPFALPLAAGTWLVLAWKLLLPSFGS